MKSGLFVVCPVVFLCVLPVVATITLAGDGGACRTSCYSSKACSEGIRLIRCGNSNDALTFLQQLPGGDVASGRLEWEELLQIVELQDVLITESGAAQWFHCAIKLKKLYSDKGMFPESYDVCRQIYERIGTVAHGIDVVNACLAYKQVDKAMSFVKHLETKFAGDHGALVVITIVKCDVLLAKGETAAAGELVRQIPFDSVKTPEALLRLAKVQAATQQYTPSTKSLTRCFELTPSSMLPAVKTEVQHLPEFKPIVSTSHFRTAMKTQSIPALSVASCLKPQTVSVSAERVTAASRW